METPAATVASKLLSLLTSNKTSHVPNMGTLEVFRVDGANYSTAIVTVSADGIEIRMNPLGRTDGPVVAVPKGLSFAAIALMIEFAAEGALLTGA